MVPKQGRWIKPEEGPGGKKVKRGGVSAYMVDGTVPFFTCRFVIVLNYLFKMDAKSGGGAELALT